MLIGIVLIPITLPILVYNTVIGRVLFKLPKSRAIILAGVIWFVSGLPFAMYNASTQYVFLGQLPDREKLAVEDLRSVVYLENYYHQQNHAVLEVNALRRYAEELIPDAQTRKIVSDRLFPALKRLSGDSADGYTFSVEGTRLFVIVHAIPVMYGGQTADSMFCFVGGATVWLEDRQGSRATLAGKRLVSFNPDI
jgi:hypothetical protein